MAELRCGIVGAGTMGALYAKALAQDENVILTAIADLDPSRAEALRGRDPGIATFRTVEDMLAAGGVDAVVVALPDFAHRDAAIACLEAGASVLCEKPLATTREDCKAIVVAEATSSGVLMVNYGNRHRPEARILRERIRGGDFGRIQSISIKGHERHGKTQTLAWRARTDPTWFLVSHLVDLATWLTDERITSVYGQGASGHPDELTEVSGPSTVTYLATLSGGAHATLSSSWILPEGYPRGGDFACELIGTRGTVSLDFNERGFRVYGNRADEVVWDFDQADFRGIRAGWWFNSCRYFARCVLDGTTPEPDVRDGARVSAVLAAMHASLESGRREEVPDWDGEGP
jgi:predicted dehydrogenase